jgi:hypothetical protein
MGPDLVDEVLDRAAVGIGLAREDAATERRRGPAVAV